MEHHSRLFEKPDGLPGSFVSDIAEDTMGNIWIGFREEGVARYNGKTFTHFSFDKSWGNSLIEIDQENRVWIFSTSPRSEQILIFNGKEFIAVDQYVEALQHLKLLPFGLYDEANKRMLLYSDSLGLIQLKNGTIEQIEGLEGRFKNFNRRSANNSPVQITSVLDNKKTCVSTIVGNHCVKLFESKSFPHNKALYSISKDKMIWHDNKEIFVFNLKTNEEKTSERMDHQLVHRCN